MNSVNTTTSHNVERISALAEKLNQIQVSLLNIITNFLMTKFLFEQVKFRVT
jgi:hypothetical protein